MRLNENAAFWDERSKIYDTQVTGIYKEAYKKNIELASGYIKKSSRVLDIGCGTGIVTFPMAEAAKEIVAVDTSKDMMEKALEKQKERGADNIHFIWGDMYADALDGEQFDLVTAFNVLLYIEDRKRAMERIFSLLKPGGFFLSAADCLGRGFSKDRVRKWIKSHTGRMPYVGFFTPEELEREIRDGGFKVLFGTVLFERPVNYFIAAQKPEEGGIYVF